MINHLCSGINFDQEEEDLILGNAGHPSLKPHHLFGKSGKPLDRYHSLNLIGSPPATVTDAEMNFSKSARSLRLYKSLLNFARSSKSLGECDIGREELENAGFFVVDADELVDCHSSWTNSQNGIFFPFITNEENFNDKALSSRSAKSLANAASGVRGSASHSQSREDDERPLCVAEQTLVGEAGNGADESGMSGEAGNFEVCFSEQKSNKIQREASKASNSIFAKFSDFFANKKVWVRFTHFSNYV